MTKFDQDILERSLPQATWNPDWSDVLSRANTRPQRAWLVRRSVIAACATIAVALPLAAYGAATDWSFLHPGSPSPAASPTVITEGEWNGQAWQLAAYPSTTDGLCFALGPKDSLSPDQGLMTCTPFAGVPRTDLTKNAAAATISYMIGTLAGSTRFVAGPVVASASSVRIRFSHGGTRDMKTVAGGDELRGVRFFVSQLPSTVRTAPGASPIRWVAGLNAEGDIVACLEPETARTGVSPPTACL